VMKFPDTSKAFKFGVPANILGIAPVRELKFATNVSVLCKVRAATKMHCPRKIPGDTYLSFRELRFPLEQYQKYQDFEK
jgi:hypothetical protein